MLFCGPMYYYAIRDDTRFRRVPPYGGIFLIAGWFSIAVLWKISEHDEYALDYSLLVTDTKKRTPLNIVLSDPMLFVDLHSHQYRSHAIQRL